MIVEEGNAAIIICHLCSFHYQTCNNHNIQNQMTFKRLKGTQKNMKIKPNKLFANSFSRTHSHRDKCGFVEGALEPLVTSFQEDGLKVFP